MQLEHEAFFTVHFLFAIRRGKHGEENAVHADGWFDDVRHVFALRRFVKIFHRLAGNRLVLRQVVIAARGNALQFLHAERELKHNIRRALRVVREFFFRVVVKRKARFRDADPVEPIHAIFNPALVKRLPIRVGRNEIFDFHLLELAGTENEVARINFVAESLTRLRNPERHFDAPGIDDIFEIDENALRGFRSQVSDRRFVAQRTDVGLEHHVERARRRERAGLARRRRRNQRVFFRLRFRVIFQNNRNHFALLRELALHVVRHFLRLRLHAFVFQNGNVADSFAGDDDGSEKQLVGAVTHFRLFAIDERVRKIINVPGRLPRRRVVNNRRIKPDNVVAAMHHIFPPRLLDIVFQLDAKRTVIEKSVVAAVNIGRLEDKAAAFAQVDDVVHQIGGRFLFAHRFL